MITDDWNMVTIEASSTQVCLINKKMEPHQVIHCAAPWMENNTLRTLITGAISG